MKYILFLSIVLLFSCGRHREMNDVNQLVFSVNENTKIDQNISCKFIRLETNDDCFIGNITGLKIVDGLIYINSQRERILVFDLSGKFIAQVGDRGNGPGEYMVISNFHVDTAKQIITVADGGQARVIRYNLKDYKHIDTRKAFYFIDCEWLSDGNIAWYFSRGYEDGHKKRFLIKISDPDLKELKLMYPMDLELLYPILAGSPFYTFADKCYFNLPHVSTVYEVSSSQIAPMYQLDLDEHQFAPTEWLEMEGVKNYSNIVNTDYVSAQNVKETDRYVCVNYYAKGANAFIGFYNKETGKSTKYPLPEFIRQTGLIGTSIVIGTFEDSFITVLSAAVLKRNPHSSIAELKSISEQVTEEDNPIICLFQLK